MIAQRAAAEIVTPVGEEAGEAGGIDVVTFGCRLNALESTVMKARAAEAGLQDVILFNTCAVTAEAVRQARQAIRRARRQHPERRIIVSGCAAQVETAAFAEMPEVDQVIGNHDKLRAASYVRAESTRVSVNDMPSVRENAQHLVAGMDGRSRAFVEIQNGCDHSCTFCIIPRGRGPSRSVPLGAIVEQITRLTERGYREAVLTGVDITAYGADLPGRPGLGRLVRTILQQVPDLARLRLSSIDSVEADAELLAAFAEEERLMPHLHLSLQSGDDMVLKRMRRRHLRAEAIRFTDSLRRLRPDIVFGADIIAGFPTESDTMFENSLAMVEECGLTHVHVFPYSPRPGTAAARMPQVDRSVVRERAARLRAAGEQALSARLAEEPGETRRILVERGGLGRTEHFLLAEISGRPGEVVAARITGQTGRGLVAVPLAA